MATWIKNYHRGKLLLQNAPPGWFVRRNMVAHDGILHRSRPLPKVKSIIRDPSQCSTASSRSSRTVTISSRTTFSSIINSETSSGSGAVGSRNSSSSIRRSGAVSSSSSGEVSSRSSAAVNISSSSTINSSTTSSSSSSSRDTSSRGRSRSSKIEETPPDPKASCRDRRRRSVIFDSFDWEGEKRHYVRLVTRHVNENPRVQDVMSELFILMSHVTEREAGTVGQWQHPSDLTQSNYQRRFGNIRPKMTLCEWQEKNQRNHARFAKIPKIFDRSAFP